MKGGITSGVVYPRAIAKLATRFTFKNVGGTSAGAIAAAAAAAAEYRRVRTGSDDGFKLLDGLGSQLATKPNGASKTMLFSLFAPNAGAKRIFEVLTGSLGHESKVAMVFITLGRAIRQYFLATLVGIVPGAGLAFASFYLSDTGVITWIWIAVGLLMAAIGSLIAIAISMSYEFVTKLPENNFGLCSGMPDPESSRKTLLVPLTVWLSEYLNEVAGIDASKPLTFGDLWNPKGNSDQGDVREVNLEMMTTNLTHGRPYRLPFRYDDDLKENHTFYFRRDEFEGLFPNSVLSWMIENPRPMEKDSKPDQALKRAERAAAGYYPLPGPADLPVVVATRMSLSFPVLLSVVPLHAMDYNKDEEFRKLERCWFTDGGVCSNFPLHFFDSPLPRRPTFSIDLTQKPNGTLNSDLIPEMDNVNGVLPVDRWNRFDLNVFADSKRSAEEKGNFGKLLGFAGTLISTMQNWNDATQGRLPGYRDRIARIPLTSEQGGLNLNMPPERVTFLTDQGEKCADVLLNHFDVPAVHPKMTWENHRWIRIRSMLAAFEKMIDETLIACDQPENGDLSYEDWLNKLNDDTTGIYKALGYRPTKAQIKASLKTITAMREIKSTWKTAGTAAKDSPRPRPTLRPRSQI